MAACVEMSHDTDGIVWPAPLAPYHVLITMVDIKNDAQQTLAAKLAKELSEQGVDVLVDDRDERPGPKFKDADLIGIPVRITLGEKAMATGGVEFKLRKSKDKGEVVAIDSVVAKAIAAING
jgi:prolyl-tRNA synthetase